MGGFGRVRCLHEYHSSGMRSRIEGQNCPVKERNCHGVKGMPPDRALVFFVDGVWHGTSSYIHRSTHLGKALVCMWSSESTKKLLHIWKRAIENKHKAKRSL